ncbi:phenylacetate-CoA oxygenase subunit PaaC [Candidatus Kapabacteria bacterium]|nr:phenylacetate-CoA oxygenase subunit PaaC [Candidatus Kapabacteria bacterium]
MTSIDIKTAKFKYALRMGDDRLILSHRLSEWCGHGPILEEDIAVTNIGLDLLGQANELLTYAGEIEGEGRDADRLAHFRIEPQYTNVKLSEIPNGNFADTIARQFVWDVFDFYFCKALKESSDEHFAAIAEKSLKEVTYHVRHTSSWVKKLGDGTEESHQKMQEAFDNVWMYTGELFEMDEVDKILIENKIAPDLNKIKSEWEETISSVLSEATIKKPLDQWMQTGARKGQHTESLGRILADLQYLPRAFPNSKW